jgi:hypothetical protein
MTEAKTSLLKRVMARTCHYCPICIYGRKYPGSMVGKMLHHKSHADRCPFWKAEKEVYASQVSP